MSIYQDYLSSLSELERLAELTRLPHLLEKITDDEWPLAMLACSLHHGQQPEMLSHTRNVYRLYQSKVALPTRAQMLATLAGFLMGQQGRAWRALIAGALEDEDALLRRQAASLIATLSPEDETKKEAQLGVRTLAELLVSEKDAPSSLLEALLSIADRRVTPYANELLHRLPEGEILRHLEGLSAPPNQLYFDWLCRVLSQYSQSSQADQADQLKTLVMDCLVRSIQGHDEVIDLVLPMPSWKFKNAEAQPLHSWTRAEYYDRMLHALREHLSEEQLEDLKHRFIHA